MSFVGVITVDNMEMVVIGEDGNVRYFDDKEIAIIASSALSPNYVILTKEEFLEKYGVKNAS